jgi:hypothetical protein
LTRRITAKQSLVSYGDAEENDSSDSEHEAILTRWSSISTDIENFAPAFRDDDDSLSNLGSKCKVFGGKHLGLDDLPEDLLLHALEYTGARGRTVSRSALRCCTDALHQNLLLPEFPVKLHVKQHYRFGPHVPVTTTWSLDISGPTEPSVLTVCTESVDEDRNTYHHLEQTSQQILHLCHELHELQAKLGPQYKEDGRVQVEVAATDAGGRNLLDHTYEYRTFCSKADDLLELLTDTDAATDSSPRVEQCGSHAQGNIRPVSASRSPSRSRPKSTSHEART